MPSISGRTAEDGAVINTSIEAAPFAVAGAFPTTALIDTGASSTAIHPMVVSQLGLRRHSFIWTSAPGASQVQRLPLYDIHITFSNGGSPFRVLAVAAAPATQSVLVLLGRDILDQCVLLYNGPGRAFHLDY